MTTPVAPTITDVSAKGDGSTILAIWAAVTESNTCNPISYPSHSDKSIQVAASAGGGFGGSSTALKGSNDGTNYSSLNDPSSTTIAITAAGIKAVLENTVNIQPVCSGGSSQKIDISVLVHFSNPART